MNLLLRKALAEDFQEIASVHHKAWLETYSTLLPKDFLDNRSLESSISIFKNNHCVDTVVAVVNGKIVGFCGWGNLRGNIFHEELSEIQGIYLLNPFKKNQIGRKMIEFALKELRLEGNQKVGLWVLSTNKNAISFYKKIGFTDTGKSREEYLGRLVIELFLIKEL